MRLRGKFAKDPASTCSRCLLQVIGVGDIYTRRDSLCDCIGALPSTLSPQRVQNLDDRFKEDSSRLQ